MLEIGKLRLSEGKHNQKGRFAVSRPLNRFAIYIEADLLLFELPEKVMSAVFGSALKCVGQIRCPFTRAFRLQRTVQFWTTDAWGHTPRLIVLADWQQSKVRIYNVDTQQLLRSVNVDSPIAMAACGSLLVVSSWRGQEYGRVVIMRPEGDGDGGDWCGKIQRGTLRDSLTSEKSKYILSCRGVSIAPDGSRVFVLDRDAGHLVVYDTMTRVYLRTIVTTLDNPYYLEPVPGGWLVTTAATCRVHYISAADKRVSSGLGVPVQIGCVAWVDGAGVVMQRRGDSAPWLLVSPDTLSMDAMSDARVVWIGVVVRGVLRRT